MLKDDRVKKLYPILLITLVLLISVSILVTLESITRSAIVARNDQETLGLLQRIFPEASFYTFYEDTEIYALYNEGRKEIGYAFYGSSRGYITDIVVLIGLEDTVTIRNIIVTQQYESYSYWDRLESDFFEQFIGLKIEDCVLKRYGYEGGGVDAATGATYSSRGVVNAVREAALEKIKYLN